MKYLIVLLLFLSQAVFAQIVEVKGKVLNASNRTPLPLANVVLINSGTGTSTDENGFFSLNGKFSESEILKVSYIGFTTVEIPLKQYLDENRSAILLQSELITSQTILVTGTVGKEGLTPISFAKIKRDDIASSYTVQDIPEIISYTPSATFYSENGNGIGYNYLSIRGFDQRRISVSINGIPQNDPEDHNVYWIDFPDLLESTELIQVQRGAGSGITGSAAIGGSINIITSTFPDKPKLELSSSLGSYNTRKYSVNYSSGLINNKYSIYTKLSQTLSSGYRDLSWVDLKSYHISAVRYDENLTTQINLFGGPLADGLAYTGLPKFAVKDKKLRKENYSYWESNDKNYTYTVSRRPDELENFSQPHFELLNDYRFNENIKFNSAMFLVLGTGFFDYDGSWSIYYDDYFRLKANGYDQSQTPINALIRAQVENKQWGWIPRMSVQHTNGELIVGGEFRFHNSIHWGSINYAENLPPSVTKNYRYYYYEGGKDIINVFAHEKYDVNNELNILVEAQVAYHQYRIENEKYLDNSFKISNTFFNPRVGLNYRFYPNWNAYISYSRVTREPRLKNYYDAAESSGGETPQFELNKNGTYDYSNPLVKPETMSNFELGASYNAEKLFASLNLFYMAFRDEIVKNGQIDRFGQPKTGNMESTIHYGIEAMLNTKLNSNIELVLNGALSKNYIEKGYAYFSNGSQLPILYRLDLSGNRISGFPDLTMNGFIKINYQNLYAQISGKYVGQFFTDNYDEKINQYSKTSPFVIDYSDNKVESYFVVNLFMSYDVQLDSYLKNIKLFAQVNNLFDNLYAAYGIGKEFYPAAERNILFGLKFGL